MALTIALKIFHRRYLTRRNLIEKKTIYYSMDVGEEGKNDFVTVYYEQVT